MKYAVYSPMRTGSMAIIGLLQQFYPQLQKMEVYDGCSAIVPNTVLHTHDLEQYLAWTRKLPRTNRIISIRNPRESLVSLLYQEVTQVSHIWDDQPPRPPVATYIPNPRRLLVDLYDQLISAYFQLAQRDLSQHLVIDYCQFSQDPDGLLPPLLGIDQALPSRCIWIKSIRNPGGPAEWFTNWEEISAIVDSFPPVVGYVTP